MPAQKFLSLKHPTLRVFVTLLVFGSLVTVLLFLGKGTSLFSPTKAENKSLTTKQDGSALSPPHTSCKYCAEGVPHPPTKQPRLSASSSSTPPAPLSPQIEHFLSRDPKNLTVEERADGSRLVHLNRTFGHLSTQTTDADGNIQIICSSAAPVAETALSSTEPKPQHPTKTK